MLYFHASKIRGVQDQFTHFQSVKRQEIDMEGNCVNSEVASENTDFSYGVGDSAVIMLSIGPDLRPHQVNKEHQQFHLNIQ